MPPVRKRCAFNLADFDLDVMAKADSHKIKAPKRRKQLDLSNLDDLL